MKSIKFLESKNVNYKLIRLNQAPKSAKDIERLYGCPLNQILKTIIFIGEKEPILVVAQWDKRIDIKKLKKITNQKNIKIAKPDEVQKITGYSISWVWPLGLENKILKIIDKNVFDMETVSIGSGEPKIWIEINSQELKKIWEGMIEEIIEKF